MMTRQEETETPSTRLNPYSWSSVTRGYVRAAGRRCGFLTIPDSVVRGYADSLIRDGAATWVTVEGVNMLELTDVGWQAFYDLTGYRPEAWNRVYQGGRRREDCAYVVFNTGEGTPEREMLVEGKSRDWETACRADWALHANGGWVFLRIEELGHPGIQR